MNPFNCRAKVTRELITDDEYGGALVTGTIIIAENEPFRLDYYSRQIRNNAPQGKETAKTYSGIFRTNRQHPVNIKEDDIVEITFPPTHEDFGKRFRVVSLQRESLHNQNPSKIIEVTLNRIEYSRNVSIE